MSSILCEDGGLFSRVFCFQRRLNEGSPDEEIRTGLNKLGLDCSNPLKSPQGKALYFVVVYSQEEGEVGSNSDSVPPDDEMLHSEEPFSLSNNSLKSNKLFFNCCLLNEISFALFKILLILI